VRVQVVIPHHSHRAGLREALASVAGWPVLVVDDGPSGAGLAAGEVPGGSATLRTAGETGFARACNAGIAAAAAAGATHALLLNDDARPEPGCVEALVAAAAGVAGPCLVGPVLLAADGSVESAGIDLGWAGRVRARRAVPAGRVAVPALSGACLLVPVSCRFDEGYPHGMEDIALCRAVAAVGWPVLLEPAARCRHTGGATRPRRSPAAVASAVHGHVRLVGGGWRAGVVAGLAVAQALREGPSPARLRAVARGLRAGLRAAE
jgi:N-acetylglucosaminyl-diphospho-decaprenol L-rhamnosyltransferase